jgi:hypothetical protein
MNMGVKPCSPGQGRGGGTPPADDPPHPLPRDVDLRRWIPCAEREPPPGYRIYAVATPAGVDTALWTGTGWTAENVTHWLPLPPHPRAQEVRP